MSHHRRSAAVSLGITALLASTLAGCADTEEESTDQAICVDEQTQERIDENRCNNDGSPGFFGGAGWYFIPIGFPFPAYGGLVTGGALRPRAGSVSSYSRPAAGGGTVRSGTVSRGGFGGSSSGRGGG